MQKVIVQIDWYTKIILTLIAVLLAGLLAKPYVAPQPVGAYAENYVTVDNSSRNPIPVTIADLETLVKVTNTEVPVRVEKDYLGTVKADVSVDPRDVFTVVDWKERKDYLKYIINKK